MLQSIAGDCAGAGGVNPLGKETEIWVNAETISIGTELLLGEIVDTNSAYIARQLRTIGLDLHYMTTVGDNLDRIAHVVDVALDRADVVITTGGLGPTVDDVTRQAIAKAVGRPLVFREDLLAQIEAFFARLGRSMPENNRLQAYIPEGSIPIPNPVGTAPAFIVETDRGVIITLPGVPREMEYLFQHAVIPYLRERLGLSEVIKVRVLHTIAVGESDIDWRLSDLMRSSNPTIGLLAHPGQTDVRITAKAENEEAADRLIAAMEARVRERLGDVIFGTDNETIESVIARLLTQRGWRLSVAQVGGEWDLPGRLAKANVSVHLPPNAWLERVRVRGEEDALRGARALRDVTGTEVGVLVAVAPEDEEARGTYIAVVTPVGERAFHVKYMPFAERRKRWIANLVLDTLRRFAIQAGESSNRHQY